MRQHTVVSERAQASGGRLTGEITRRDRAKKEYRRTREKRWNRIAAHAVSRLKDLTRMKCRAAETLEIDGEKVTGSCRILRSKKRSEETLWDPPFEEKQKEEKRKSGGDDSYDGDLEERPNTIEVGLGGSAGEGDRAGTLELSLLRVLPKLGGGKKLRDVRMIALSSTLCEWMPRVVVTALQE